MSNRQTLRRKHKLFQKSQKTTWVSKNAVFLSSSFTDPTRPVECEQENERDMKDTSKSWLTSGELCIYIYTYHIYFHIYIWYLYHDIYIYIYVCIDIYTCISYISTFLLESFNSCCAGYTTFDYTAGFLWPERIVRCLPLHHQMLVYLAWLVCRECLAAKRGIIYHDTWFIDLDLAYPKTPQKWCQRKSQTFFLEEKLPKRPETIPKELGIKISSELRPPPLETNENEIIVPGDIVRATQKKTMASWVQANGRDTHTHSHFLVFFFSNSELLHRGFWLERMFFVFSFCYTSISAQNDMGQKSFGSSDFFPQTFPTWRLFFSHVIWLSIR